MSTQNLHKNVNNRITHKDQNLKVTKKFSVTENTGSKILFKAKVKYDPRKTLIRDLNAYH